MTQNDREILLACAQIIGMSDKEIMICDVESVSAPSRYHPFTNDKQLMDLVRKYPNHACEAMLDAIRLPHAVPTANGMEVVVPDFSRAICARLAQLHATNALTQKGLHWVTPPE